MRGLLDLWTAHRELSGLEWLEFRETMVAALAWLACATIGLLAGWIALNAAVFIVLRQHPLQAALVIAAVNVAAALVAGLQVGRLVRRPFFALTKREASRDVDALFEELS